MGHMLSLCLYGMIESDILQNMLVCYICEYVPSEDVRMTYRLYTRIINPVHWGHGPQRAGRNRSTSAPSVIVDGGPPRSIIPYME